MDDRELSPILREAYRGAVETAEPSELLWRRTRRSLREHGLLRHPSPRNLLARVAAVAAVAAFAGFLLGWTAGRGTAPGGATRALSTPVEPGQAVERVQREGTDYARALEALAHSLDRADGAQVATGQQVLMALTGAHSELIRAVAPVGYGATERRQRAPTAFRESERSTDAPLIWF